MTPLILIMFKLEMILHLRFRVERKGTYNAHWLCDTDFLIPNGLYLKKSCFSNCIVYISMNTTILLDSLSFFLGLTAQMASWGKGFVLMIDDVLDTFNLFICVAVKGICARTGDGDISTMTWTRKKKPTPTQPLHVCLAFFIEFAQM